MQNYFGIIDQIFLLSPILKFCRLFCTLSYAFTMFLVHLVFILGLGLSSMLSCDWWTEMDTQYQSFVTLMRIYMRYQYKSFTSHPFSWKLKIFFFHLVMIPYYLWSIAWDWTKRKITFILGIMLGPVLIGCPSLFHYLLAFWSATDIVLSSWAHQESKGKALWLGKETRIQLFNQFQMHRPVPKEWMSLSGVQLKQEFVGLMMKLGHHPNPFWAVPQKFADGSTDIARALNSKSLKI